MTENIIIVNSCDAYEDVWELFFRAFQDHWIDCKYKIILNTQEKQKEIVGMNIGIHNYISLNGSDNWGLRLKETLKACDSKYVLMLYDDFILEGRVNQKKINTCMEWLDENPDVVVFYFTNNSANKNVSNNRFEGFELIPHKGDYKLNSAPSIWRREKLIKLIQDNDNPWAWELFGSYRTYSIPDSFYCAKQGHEDIYPYNDSMGGAIYRGKWVGQVVIPLIKKYNLQIDVNKRGLADDFGAKNKRSLKWKIEFIVLGFNMIGWGVFLYVYRILKRKIGA